MASRSKFSRTSTICRLVAGIILCQLYGPSHSAPTFARTVKGEAKGFRSAEHVVIIGTDGLGALITGMGPQESGIYSNSWLPPQNGTLPDVSPISGAGKIPETMWRAAKTEDSGVVVAVAESWDWINYLVENDTVDYNYRCMSQDALCVPKILYFVREKCPNLMFFHFESIDIAGHKYTWGSSQYYEAAKIVDGYIGEIMNAFVEADIFDQTLFIIVSDHGGYGLTHEKFDEICIRIPILMMGPKVKKGYTIGGYSSNTDIAPTALNALGLHSGKYMYGKVSEEVYQ